jgi:hypothetical protein
MNHLSLATTLLLISIIADPLGRAQNPTANGTGVAAAVGSTAINPEK